MQSCHLHIRLFRLRPSAQPSATCQPGLLVNLRVRFVQESQSAHEEVQKRHHEVFAAHGEVLFLPSPPHAGLASLKKNKSGPAQVGAISKAKNWKWGNLRAL